MFPFVPQRQGHGYIRHGTTNLYAALNVASGNVMTQTTPAHQCVEFLAFLGHIDEQVPKDLDDHLIMDNYATHKTDAVRKWNLAHPRFHFTPTYSSWKNLVERWFSELTTKMLQQSTHTSEKQLVNAITKWTETWDENPRPFRWHKTADQIFKSMEKYLGPLTERTSD